MDKPRESHQEVSSVVSRAIQRRGASRAEAMQSIGAVLANPPASLVEMVKASGVDLRRIRSDDEAQLKQIADLVEEAIRKFDESSREVQYAISATLHPGHPLSPSGCREASTPREASR